jgi:hypothetical protein
MSKKTTRPPEPLVGDYFECSTSSVPYVVVTEPRFRGAVSVKPVVENKENEGRVIQITRREKDGLHCAKDGFVWREKGVTKQTENNSFRYNACVLTPSEKGTCFYFRGDQKPSIQYK